MNILDSSKTGTITLLLQKEKVMAMGSLKEYLLLNGLYGFNG